MSKNRITLEHKENEISPIGIDFGTTNSSIAYAVPDAKGNIEVRAVVHDDHFPKIPTAVFVEEIIREENGAEIIERKYIVGNEALELGVQFPENLYKEFKRDLWKKLKPLNDGFEINAKNLAEHVFKYLLKHAEKEGFKDIRPVVCHPVGERWAKMIHQILQDHLNISADLLSEPEAALYYAHHQYHVFDEKDETILLIDFGGGTCDFLLMRVHISNWKRLLTKPDPEFIDDDRLDFAGQDVDEILINHWRQQWTYSYPDLKMLLDDFEQPQLKWRMKKKAVEIKHQLSKNYARGKQYEEVPFVIYGLPNDTKLETSMTPMDLRTLTESEIENKFRYLLLENDEKRGHRFLLGRKGIFADDVTMIILTGGSSQLPWVSEEILPKIFPSLAAQKKILLLDNPSMSVSYGAALYAYDSSNQRLRMKKFLQEDLMIELEDGTPQILVKRGTPLPFERSLFERQGYETFDFPRTGRKLLVKLIAGIGHRASDLRPLSYEPKFFEFSEEIEKGKSMDMEIEINEKGEVSLYISKAGFWHSCNEPLRFSPLKIGLENGTS